MLSLINFAEMADQDNPIFQLFKRFTRKEEPGKRCVITHEFVPNAGSIIYAVNNIFDFSEVSENDPGLRPIKDETPLPVQFLPLHQFLEQVVCYRIAGSCNIPNVDLEIPLAATDPEQALYRLFSGFQVESKPKKGTFLLTINKENLLYPYLRKGVPMTENC